MLRRLPTPLALLPLAALVTVAGCTSEPSDPCARGGGEAAPATCVVPTFPPSYYVEQAHLYFDRLEWDTDPSVAPNYSAQTVRWEWHPWLKLTGYTRDGMLSADLAARLVRSTVPTRDCRFFETNPFARCRVVFEYENGGPCPIYEEFAFDANGEMTFIEAWSDFPEFLPESRPDDPWFERAGVLRLSTRVAGLGSPSGLFDPLGPYILEDAERDPYVADLQWRTQDFYAAWFDEHMVVGEDYFARGCGW